MRRTAVNPIAFGHWLPWVCVVLGIVILTPREARPDRIQLRGGGEIRGAILPDPSRPETVLVQTMNGSSPIAFSRDDVARVIREEDIFDEYYDRLPTVDSTAEAQHAFGLWCEEHELTGLAPEHYRRAVELDRDFGPAHKKLGHVEHNGRWLTYDELRAAQGLVQHEGQWIARDEMRRIEVRQADQAEHTAWVRQIRVLRQGLTASSPDERAEVERRLFELRDPSVVPALVDVLGDDAERYARALLVRLLDSIEGPEATAALVRRCLDEDDDAIRQRAIGALARRGDPEAARLLIGVLDSKNIQTSGRAALALAGLGAVEAVPKLIEALVRIERRPVLVPSMQARPAPAPVGFRSISGYSIPVLTGPAVGPGVVAYGATSVPYGSGVTLSMGSGGVEPGPPVFRMLTRVHRNTYVLAALEALTGRRFGYDSRAWKRWLATSFPAAKEPARRVPQP